MAQSDTPQLSEQGSRDSTGALALKHVRRGAGIPLVLVHAFPVDSRMWDRVIEHLPEDLGIYTVDLPGMGASPAPDDVARHLGFESTPSLELAATALADLVRSEGVDQAVFVGLSLGGYVVLALLEQDPHLVAGVGLFDTKTTADRDEARLNRLRIADQVEHDGSVDAVRGMATSVVGPSTRSASPEIVAELGEWIEQQSPQGVAWAQRAMAARPDRGEVLARFAGPVSVVVGEEDELSPVEGSRLMASSAQDASFTVIAGVGHMTAIEAPTEVADVIVELMARVH